MLKLKTQNPNHLLTCISYCGKIDRLLYVFSDDYTFIENTLMINAGFSSDQEPGGRSEMIAKGTLEWLREFHNDPVSFSLSNTAVKSMHRKIFKYSVRDDGTRGRYRTDLDDEIKALFEETKTALASDERHSLFLISLFRVSFIDAMPFITGNSLIANIIAYALLYTEDLTIVSQIPLLASLNNANSAASKDALSLLPKTIFELLSNTPASLHTQGSTHQPRSSYLNQRRKSLLLHIKNNAPLKISDIMNKFQNESRNTIKKDLVYLREKDMISARGKGRGMFYTVDSRR